MNEALQEFTNWLLTIPPEDAEEIAEVINRNLILDTIRWHNSLMTEKVQ